MVVERADHPEDKAQGYHFIGISLHPVDHAEKKKNYLRKSYEMLMASDLSRRANLLQLGRSINSLAEHLSYGSDDDKQEARQLFEKRLSLDSENHLKDIPGLARTHGGLGRLAFFSEVPDIDMARHHFSSDLKFSEQIGDISGQARMLSLLGACDLREGLVDQAQSRYEKSLLLSEFDSDKIFALVGLMECSLITDQTEETDRCGRQILAIVSESGLPQVCRNQVSDIVKKIDGKLGFQWLDGLKNHMNEEL